MLSAAGNTLTYDVDNRAMTATGANIAEWYGYGADSKRVWKKRHLGGTSYEENVYFYGVTGQRIGTYTLTDTSGTLRLAVKETNIYFGGKVLKQGSTWVAMDRLASVRYRSGSPGTRFDYWPYGEEKPDATPQDRDKFATYMRDHTNLDYADQRYYTNGTGRFVTADSRHGEGTADDMIGVNKYTYASNDPANRYDPEGRHDRFTPIIIIDGIPTNMPLPRWVIDVLGLPWSVFTVDVTLPIPQTPPERERGPVIAPDPQGSEPAGTCDISVAYSGTPINGQNFVGLTPYAPEKNELGPYNTLNRSNVGPRFRGWFFATQIQGSMYDDTDPSHWTARQTYAISGTVQIQPLGGPVPAPTPYTDADDDSPEPFATYRGSGRVSWLDAPGFSRFQSNGGLLVGADLTMRFTSTLSHTSGASCTVSWSLRLGVKDGQGGMTR